MERKPKARHLSLTSVAKRHNFRGSRPHNSFNFLKCNIFIFNECELSFGQPPFHDLIATAEPEACDPADIVAMEENTDDAEDGDDEVRPYSKK